MKLKPIAYSFLVLSLGFVTAARAHSAQPNPAPIAAGQEGGDARDRPPAEFRDIQRQGFRDGIEGARKDFDNHREPNVDNREEYRHPHVDRAARDDYREGYRRGYEVGMRHLQAQLPKLIRADGLNPCSHFQRSSN